MPLEFRKQRDGSLRRIWYGRYRVNGKKHTMNLGVKIEGTPPESLSVMDRGDTEFELSRMKAQVKLESIIDQIGRKDMVPLRLAEHIYEMKTGERLQSVKLENLPEAWDAIPRRSPPCDRYVLQCHRWLKRFRTFIEENYPHVKALDQVTRQMAEAFMEHEKARGIAAKTWNDKLKLMRATCKHVLPSGCANPFERIVPRKTDPTCRQPFTQEELGEILKYAAHDDFIRPIIILGMCTAMRKGDCCQLRRDAVNLDEGFLAVKTSKTGAMVTIPIFPMLYNELIRQKQDGEEMFPEQAKMFRENPDGITWRVKKVLKAAKIETQVERPDGAKKASVKGFHSFRTTWITMALSAGVPMELVRRVTGHSTVDVVLKHYFRPGKEAFKAALETAMPKMLTSGEKEEPKDAEETPKDALLQLVEQADRVSKESFVAQVAKIAHNMALQQNSGQAA